MNNLRNLGSIKNESSGDINLNNNRSVNNINLHRQKGNFTDNVFITTYDPGNKTKKLLVQISNDIFRELNNNRNRIKNHRVFPIKSLLVEDIHINFENFNGQVKIWLIFNQLTQVLDYIIQIIPTSESVNNRNQNLKKLINKLLSKIDCRIILKTLKKFGINVDKQLTENCKKFRWSFHVSNIPLKSNNRINFPYTRGPVILNPISLSNLNRKPTSN